MTGRSGDLGSLRAAPGRVIGEARGTDPGPTVVLVGGLHANEPSGIAASERLLAALNGPEPLSAGRVLALRGNLAALGVETSDPVARPRYLDHDLNRAFSDNRPAGREAAEAAELEDCLRSIRRATPGRCILIDLHTFSSDAPAFVAMEDSLPNRRFAMGIPLPKILGMEEELNGLLMDYVSDRLGYVSCIIESGRHDDPRSVDVHEAAVRHALASEGMLASAGEVRGVSSRVLLRRAAGGRSGRFYDVRERVPIRAPGYRTEATADAFMRVRGGQTVIGADEIGSVTPGVDGLLFMPNRQREPREGDDAFFVVRRIGPVWLRLSSVLRSSERVHRWLPRLLPGVRRRGEHGLLVAPEIAVVLRREMLHLLGYRLVRWTHAPRMGVVARCVRGLLAFGGACTRMLAGAFRGGEPAQLPEERPTDWIVRRRVQDVGGWQDQDASSF